MAERLYEDAVRAFETGDLKEAERGFHEFHRAHPDHDLADNALYQLGMVLCMTGRREEGLAAFEACVTRYAGTDAAPLAASQAAVTRDELAMAEAEEVRGAFRRGRDLAGKGDLEGAKALFLECIQAHQGHALTDNVYLSLSMIYSLQGQYAQARSILEKILEQFPDSDAAASVPAALRRLEWDERYQ